MLHPTINESGPLYSLPCEVIVPASIRSRFFGKGMAAGTQNENRSYVRFACDTDRIRVGVRFLNELPTLERNEDWKAGILVDLSKGGLQFLFHEEIFPGESLRIAIETDDGLETIDARVARCRRLASFCYAIGLARLAV